MPMVPFISRFPDLGGRETRLIRAIGKEELPDGEYAFVELYCDERGCDCRRVMIDVLREDMGWKKIWATISYGWEGLEFYRKWSHGFEDPAQTKGPYLDLLNPQTRHSPVLLDLFRNLIESPEYVDRLRRHYEMFRATVEGGQEEQRPASRHKRLRDLRRRGRRGRH